MSAKVALVTGANRGMGLETVRQLAQLGYQVILTCRDKDLGLVAVEKLNTQGLHVDCQSLDVTDINSIQELAGFVQQKYHKLDVLVNNAGILLDSPNGNDWGTANNLGNNLYNNAKIIRQTFETNTLGPLLLSKALIPLMHDNGRIVNVSSGMGQLSGMNGGWTGYRISKTALNAVTRILADELKDTHIKVNSVCPGWVRTDMGGPGADRTVTKGVETTVWLATLDDSGPSGGFFRDKLPIDW